MANVLPPPPINDQPGSFVWLEWYRQLRNYISQSGSVPWSVIDFAGSNLTDITSRNHANLQVLQGGTSGEYYHLTNAQYTDIITGSYGAMYIDNGAVTRTIAATNTYYEIASGFTTGPVSQFTFQNSKELKCNRAGTYHLTWQITRSVPGVSQEVECAALKNGSYIPSSTSHAVSLTASTQFSVSGSCIIALAVDDLVSLGVNNNTSTNTVTISHANLSLHKIGT